MLLQSPVIVQVINRWRSRGAHFIHQGEVRLELLIYSWRDSLNRFELARFARFFVFIQGCLGILGGQQGGSFTCTVRKQHANHHVTKLDGTRFNPRSRLLPEHIAIRAIGIGKHIDDPRCIMTAVCDPTALFQSLPHFLPHWFVDQAFQRLLAEIFASRVEQIPDEHVLAILSQIQCHSLSVEASSVTFQAGRRVEGVDDSNPLRLQGFDRGRPLLSQCVRCREKRQNAT